MKTLKKRWKQLFMSNGGKDSLELLTLTSKERV